MIFLKAFFLDIDGTLATDNKKVTEENLKAIKEAQAKGNLVFINTGRASSRLPYEISGICHPDGIITSLGATIKIGGKTVCSYCTTVEETVKIYKIAIPSGWHMYFDTEYQKYEINVPQNRIDRALSDPANQRDRLLKYSDKTDEFVITGEDYIKSREIHLAKLVAFPEPTGFSQVEKLSEFFNIHRIDCYYDLSLKKCGKDTAVKKVCELLNIDRKDTVAVGDSENDIPMLDYAEVGAVVKNASDSAKLHADYISDKTNNESAVAEIIRKFIG